jgi:hypothetical protein
MTVLVSGTHLGPRDQFFFVFFKLSLDSWVFVDVGSPLWQEVKSCQRSLSQVQVLWDSLQYVTATNLRLLQPEGPGS